MQTFNILGNNVSFDDELSVYANFYVKTVDEIEKFSNSYKTQRITIKTVDEFYAYAENVRKFVQDECRKKVEIVLNILVNNQIYDKSIDDIGVHISALNDFFKYIENSAREMYNYMQNLDVNFEDFRLQATMQAEESVQPYYLGVISSSSWDIVTTDILNDIEEAKVKKKRQRMVDGAMYKKGQELIKASNEFAIKIQSEIKDKAYTYGVSAIKQIFDYCLEILISENKISRIILNNLQKQKAENILNNLYRMQNESIKKEQIVVALKAYPFAEKVHSEILNYNINELDDYIKLIKFIKCEHIILNLCLKKHSNISNNEKYINILKQLDENNIYYQKYIDYIGNTSINETSVDTNNSISNVNTPNLDNSTKLTYNINYNTVFDTFFISAYSIGKIKIQDKLNGHIEVHCPMNLIRMLNPVTIYIKISKINENETIVNLGTYSKYDTGIIKSAPKWLKLLLDKVSERL